MPLAWRGSGYTPGFALGVLYLVVLFVDAFATVIVPRGPVGTVTGATWDRVTVGLRAMFGL
jgi:hypothetical protein